MWAGRGQEHAFEGNEYLASIARTSPETARAVLEQELHRARTVRLWIFEVLDYAAWGPHDPACRCGLDAVDDPVVRVVACSKVVKEILEEKLDGPESGDLYTFVQVHPPEAFIPTLLGHPRLNDHLHAEMEIRRRELASRRARFALHARLVLDDTD